MGDSYDGSLVAWREIPGNNKLVCSAFHANQPITATTNVLQHCYTFKIHGAMPAILHLHLVARCYNGYPLILTHHMYVSYTGGSLVFLYALGNRDQFLPKILQLHKVFNIHHHFYFYFLF